MLAGALLGCTYFTATPANAVLMAAQMNRTPAPRQGRVMAASLLIAGLAAPLGPPSSGILLDAAGPTTTFRTLTGPVVVEHRLPHGAVIGVVHACYLGIRAANSSHNAPYG